jgi:hypothetical protein
MRFNTGGNLDIAKPFFERLAAIANERKIKVYVITGRATFLGWIVSCDAVAAIRECNLSR